MRLCIDLLIDYLLADFSLEDIEEYFTLEPGSLSYLAILMDNTRRNPMTAQPPKKRTSKGGRSKKECPLYLDQLVDLLEAEYSLDSIEVLKGLEIGQLGTLRYLLRISEC